MVETNQLNRRGRLRGTKKAACMWLSIRDRQVGFLEQNESRSISIEFVIAHSLQRAAV